MKPCTLYRHFNRNGVLLYVGISIKPLNRSSDHLARSRWYEQIATITLEHYPSIAECHNAERLAIAQEFPLYNVKHKARDLSCDIDSVTVQDVL